MNRNNADTPNMALFCDFENVALGVKDARYEHFDIGKILERLLLKGSIVVKKAYCDWDRYKDFKSSMHQASFEMIEIPHLRMSGKNSADIRMVVDALDLCYTKAHVDTFVIISGDSDFSPLVSKLRENNKTVIGVGVKNSTSDLLIANCDEFIFYDDLVREQRRRASVAKARAPVRRKTEGGEKGERSDKPDTADRIEKTVEKAEKVEKSEKGENKTGRTGAEERTDKAARGGRGERGGKARPGKDPADSNVIDIGRDIREERKEEASAALIGAETPPYPTTYPTADPTTYPTADQAANPTADPTAGEAAPAQEGDAPAGPSYEPLTSDEAMAEPLGMGGNGGSSSVEREERVLHGLELVVETIDALMAERGEDERIWGSMVKQTLKRRNPGFNEVYYGFKSFNRMLEEARDRNLIELENDDKSGGYIVRTA